MHLPFAKALKSAPHSPFANSLQRIGKHTAFAKGECICHSLKRMAKPVAKASLCQKRFGFFHSKPK
jgi:hypothetical protein